MVQICYQLLTDSKVEIIVGKVTIMQLSISSNTTASPMHHLDNLQKVESLLEFNYSLIHYENNIISGQVCYWGRQWSGSVTAKLALFIVSTLWEF